MELGVKCFMLGRSSKKKKGERIYLRSLNERGSKKTKRPLRYSSGKGVSGRGGDAKGKMAWRFPSAGGGQKTGKEGNEGRFPEVSNIPAEGGDSEPGGGDYHIHEPGLRARKKGGRGPWQGKVLHIARGGK